MKYGDYLKSPDVEKAFNDMFDQRRDYYRLKSREFGITAGRVELYSIKMAYLSTDIHFTQQYNLFIKDDADVQLLAEDSSN